MNPYSLPARKSTHPPAEVAVRAAGPSSRLAAVAAVEVTGIDELKGLIGKEIGPGDWREVTQQDIDDFARLSGDDQWIHVDVDRAKRESPFGTTIAHGNLTLSLTDGLRSQLIEQGGVKMGINYGFDKVRFPAAVPAGTRVRARAELLTVEELGDGWWHVVTKYTIEGEQAEKPVCVAESVGRALVA
jgi:acyl dehydratase